MPQDLDLALTQPIADKTKARLARLESEISQLQTQLKELEAEHAILPKDQSQNTAVLSPFSRLPVELLAEVFFWTLPPMSGAPLDINKSPWLLTHVCSQWRAVAVSKSSLWSPLSIDFSLKPNYSLAMVKTQIERARTLKVRFYGARYRALRPQVDILELLLQHSSIWEEIRIQLTRDLVPYVEAFADPLPVLRRAWVQWNGADSQRYIESIDCFKSAVSLTDIGACSQYQFIPILLPMHRQLTRYDFDAPWNTHCELLKSLPCLHEVRITCAFGVSEEELVAPINLPLLKRLYVSHAEILEDLKAPSLTELAVCGGPSDYWEDFLLQSSCSLRRLCIEGMPDTYDTVKILEQFSSITELAVKINGEADVEQELLADFLAHFTVSNAIPILPHMTELGFGYCNGSDVYYPEYLDMLASRWNAGDCALKAAELMISEPHLDPDPISLARLDMLRQDGLNISLLSGEAAETRMNRWSHIASWD
ncbi:hypothetical protein MSAN_00516200 [Mycena sanguinolenta]|uniref:F-box domain-containing protein n=1 Tax=Mycena sanguinolenta TaxID=230812 RepID=A0A8H6Z9F6_9AGAR|nr:hypothetical protein MSAN_00516200 [Mycena sanguinolenta]